MKYTAATVVLLFVCLQVIQGASVRRNVKDYGAKGDGQTDDTKAIISALTDGRGLFV